MSSWVAVVESVRSNGVCERGGPEGARARRSQGALARDKMVDEPIASVGRGPPTTGQGEGEVAAGSTGHTVGIVMDRGSVHKGSHRRGGGARGGSEKSLLAMVPWMPMI